jgi:hypothetical protein
MMSAIADGLILVWLVWPLWFFPIVRRYRNYGRLT